MLESATEVVKVEERIIGETDPSQDSAELDRIFDGMLRERFGVSLNEMLAKAELARQFGARPISQLPMEQRMYLFAGRAKITCTKCHRKFFEPILQPWVQRADGKVVLCMPVDVHGCSKCTRAKTQPREGDTFHPERRKSRGKFITVGRGNRGHRDTLTFDGQSIAVARTRDITDESLTEDSLMSWAYQEQVNQNAESQIREQLLIPDNISAAEIDLRDKTVREIQRRWNLTYYTARSGSIRLLKLAVPDSDVRKPPEPQPSNLKQPPRECRHGRLMHRDDRRKKSRNCGLCYPLGNVAGRPRKSPAWVNQIP